MIIDKPGFYTSKAGKCEVKYADDEFAFGYDVYQNPCVWHCLTGFAPDARNHDITGPWIDKPKPIELWCVLFADGNLGPTRTGVTRQEAQNHFDGNLRCGNRPVRLVHLIEAEDRG